MGEQTAGWRTEGGWYIFDGGAVAQRVSNGPRGCTQADDSRGPGGRQTQVYTVDSCSAYWEECWEEMKDMLNDALGG